MQEEQLHLQLNFSEKYKPVTDEVVKSVSLELSPHQIREGLIKQFTLDGTNQGARNFIVLLAIASHMDSNNKAFPSQTRIAEITGYSRTTVINAIKDLETLTVGGQKILERKKVPTSRGHFKTIYKFSAVAGDELEELVETVEEEKSELSARDVLVLFCDYYEETFGTKYMPNWGRDVKMIQQKLMATFTSDELKEIVEVAVTEYPVKWANKNYPVPSVGQLCTWLANEANKVVLQNNQKEKQLEKRIEAADKYSEVDSLGLLDSL